VALIANGSAITAKRANRDLSHKVDEMLSPVVEMPGVKLTVVSGSLPKKQELGPRLRCDCRPSYSEILVAKNNHLSHPFRVMDDAHIMKVAEVLVACHGNEAAKVARRRAAKCARRGQSEWAELYEKVADEIVRQQPSPQP
jgi:hypothetical protein